MVGNLLRHSEQQVVGMPALPRRRHDCKDGPMHVRRVGDGGSAQLCGVTSTSFAMLSMVALRLCEVHCRACADDIRALCICGACRARWRNIVAVLKLMGVATAVGALVVVDKVWKKIVGD